VLADNPTMVQAGLGIHLLDMDRPNTTQITKRNRHPRHLPTIRLKTMAVTTEVEKIKATLVAIVRLMSK